MLDRSIFSKSYILQKKVELKCDPTILERAIFASGLLEAMILSGAKFIFKGGSSLLFLLDKPLRLSTDIDILIEPGTDIMSYILKASETYPFIRYEESIRKSINNIEKRHFKFFYKSLTDERKEITILLDVLFEKNHYSKIITKEIKNDLLKTTGIPVYVNLPSHESLLGDKMTAFAPKTIGVKPFYKKDNGIIIDKRIETIKQFFDIASLYSYINNFDEVYESYHKTALAELKYRDLNLTIKDCLYDTFIGAASIMSRGKIDSESYKNYLIGIRGLSGFLINKKFNAENAYSFAAKVMYLSVCIIKNEKPLKFITDQDYIKGEFSKINYIKKIDKQAFNMAAYSITLLNK